MLVGKKIKQAKFTLVRNDEVWNFTLDADNFSFRSMTLPNIEGQLDPISHFEERIRYLDIFRRSFLQLFGRYLTLVTNTKKLQDMSESFHNWVENIDTDSTDEANTVENFGPAEARSAVDVSTNDE